MIGSRVEAGQQRLHSIPNTNLLDLGSKRNEMRAIRIEILEIAFLGEYWKQQCVW